MLRGHRYIFLLVVLLPIQKRRWLAPLLALGSRRWKGGRGDPSAFSVNLFGIPEIPEALPRAISLARLHNIVFISSCNLVHASRIACVRPLFSSHFPFFAFLSPTSPMPCTRANGTVGELRLVPSFRTNGLIYANLKWAIRVTRKSTTLPFSPTPSFASSLALCYFATFFLAARSNCILEFFVCIIAKLPKYMRL